MDLHQYIASWLHVQESKVAGIICRRGSDKAARIRQPILVGIVPKLDCHAVERIAGNLPHFAGDVPDMRILDEIIVHVPFTCEQDDRDIVVRSGAGIVSVRISCPRACIEVADVIIIGRLQFDDDILAVIDVFKTIITRLAIGGDRGHQGPIRRAAVPVRVRPQLQCYVGQRIARVIADIAADDTGQGELHEIVVRIRLPGCDDDGDHFIGHRTVIAVRIRW